jgi:hypothetical protein
MILNKYSRLAIFFKGIFDELWEKTIELGEKGVKGER